MSPISLIGCIVGIIGCVVGIATFVSAQLTRAKQDGVLIAKIDQCVKGIEELKSDVKERNDKFDHIIDEHSRDITKLKEQVHILMTKVGL